MAVKIRLKRLGKIRAPYYRIVVADSRTKRDGRAIEEIGKYHPTEEPSFIEVDRERVQHWLSVGAQPTEQVEAILKITGDWQTFKGLPGTEGTLRTKAPKVAVVDTTDFSADKRERPKKAAKTDEAPAAEKAPPPRRPPPPQEPAAADATRRSRPSSPPRSPTPTSPTAPTSRPRPGPRARRPDADQPVVRPAA